VQEKSGSFEPPTLPFNCRLPSGGKRKELNNLCQFNAIRTDLQLARKGSPSAASWTVVAVVINDELACVMLIVGSRPSSSHG
jgi:hypothetical protein